MARFTDPQLGIGVTWNGTGTGAFSTLTARSAEGLRLPPATVNGVELWYVCRNPAIPSQLEMGGGLWNNTAGTWARTTVLYPPGGTPVSFGAGAKRIDCVPSIRESFWLVGDGKTIREGTDFAPGTLAPVSNAVWGAPSGMNVTITSASSALPILVVGQQFQVTEHAQANNNGVYLVNSSTGGSLSSTKLYGAAPVAAAAEAVSITYWYPVNPEDPATWFLKVAGSVANGDQLSDAMNVYLDPVNPAWRDRVGAMARVYVEKTDASAHSVTVIGAGDAATSTRSLVAITDYLFAQRIAGSGPGPSGEKFLFQGMSREGFRAKLVAGASLVTPVATDLIPYYAADGTFKGLHAPTLGTLASLDANGGAIRHFVASSATITTDYTFASSDKGRLKTFSGTVQRTWTVPNLGAALQGAAITIAHIGTAPIVLSASGVTFRGETTLAPPASGEINVYTLLWLEATGQVGVIGPREPLATFTNITGSMALAPSGNSWHPTGNLTNLPATTNGWWAKIANKSGVARTITPPSPAVCRIVETGTTGASVTLGNNKSCFLHADGTDLWVEGDVS